MNKREQKAFVMDLSRNIAREIAQQIDSGKIPPEWDGHELRCLLAKRFIESAEMTIIKRLPTMSRAREFRNTVIVNNL